MSRAHSRRPAGRSGTSPARTSEPVPVVGGRQPCPCGSGRRYKACHGRDTGGGSARVARPFAGVPGEVDWVALREIVPSAVAELSLAGRAAELAAATGVRGARVGTVLPLAAPAWHRPDGTVFVSVQAAGPGLDAAREVSAALLAALAAPPGEVLGSCPVDAQTPDLADLLAPEPPAVRVTEGFQFWFDGWPEPGEDPEPDLVASRERADTAVQPTWAVPGQPGAYLTRAKDRNHLRWVLPYPEDPAVDALARVSARSPRALHLAGGRFLGVFRTLGVIAPVWEMPDGLPAEDLAGPLADMAAALADATGAGGALSSQERHARAGILARQVTVR